MYLTLPDLQMMTSASIWRRHPVFAYLALVYALIWGGILIVMGASGFNLKELKPLDTASIFMAMLLGPCVGGLVMLAGLDGRAGLRKLASSLIRWRVCPIWCAVAILTIQTLLLAVYWPLGAMLDPAYAPGMRWQLFAVGLVAGTFEEIGWTGFATPQLLARHRVFMAGFGLVLAWALWHVRVDFRQNFSTLGIACPLEFAVFNFAALTADRVLMTWLYANTHSLLLAVPMHACNMCWLPVLCPATSFQQGLLWQAALAFALWLIVAVFMTRFVHRERADSPLPCTIEVRGPT
jgi:membrane protease YdiL (CAAX protease family)